MPIPVERLRPILIEALRRDFGGQWIGLTQAVAWVATERRIYPELQDTRIVQLDAADEVPLRALVEALIAEGILTLGTHPGNRRWPWLSLTERGRALESSVVLTVIVSPQATWLAETGRGLSSSAPVSNATRTPAREVARMRTGISSVGR